jgi:hypothetical protein
MANQTQSLTLPPPRTYTRTDFTALRAFVQRLPAATIARLYYDPKLAPHAATPEAMDRYLRTMRDELVQLALLHGSPVLAGHLKASVRQHGSAKLTAVTLRMVEQASTLAAAVPAADRAAAGRGGDRPAGGARRLLQRARRQLVARGAAHRRAARDNARRMAAAA